jgi:DNA-directed RNA polymerase specialized sigma24 family protein
MAEALRKPWSMAEQDQQISEAIAREQGRLRNFIRKRVADQGEAEDVLQDVFYELIEAYRMMSPVEEASAWLFRVARNRIIDLFRRKKREAARSQPVATTDDGETLEWEDLLPSPDAEEQREVFVAHELMGYSFKEIAEQTGISVNTLLSRKHYAVLHLRERLRDVYDELTKG